jgi:hypothetical protein
MDLQTVRPGDPFQPKAETWNALVDTARWAREQRGRTGGAFGPSPREVACITVANNAGRSLRRFEAVGVTGVVTVPSDAQPDATNEFLSRTALTVGVPTSDDAGRWLVLLEPLEPNAVGRAACIGAVPCRVNVGDTDDAFADVADGETVPVSGGRGMPLLWVAGGAGSASSTGEQWAVVLLRGGSSGGGPSDLPEPTAEGQVLIANSAKVWVAAYPKLHP